MQQELGLHRISSPAKITRPRLPEIVPRERLFQLLDKSRQYPVVWITGPAGSGKTTLAASYLAGRQIPCIWYQIDEGDASPANFFYYLGLAAKKAAPRYRRSLPFLTPEYGLSIQTFAKRYFEELFARLKRPSALVLDNYQDMSAKSGLHEVLVNGLSVLPQDQQIIVISRSAPPAPYARLQANNELTIIDWEQLRLTPDELAAFMLLQCSGPVPGELVRAVYEKTRGWAAGVVLLCHAVTMKAADSDSIKNLDPEKVFDYFLNEIFARADACVQELLLKTACMPSFAPKAAESLSGNTDAGTLLLELNRTNCFIEKRTQPEMTYQYHPLFREFLLSMGRKTFSPDTITKLKQYAAQLLEDSRSVDDAAELYRESKDWDGLTRLILGNAQSMVMQGRSETIEKWVLAVPDATRQASPWLLYWLGACRFACDPRKARPHFSEAYAQFKRLRDRTGLLLSWTGIVDTYLHAWDDFTPLKRWTRELKSLMKLGNPFPSPDIEIAITVRMFTALFFIQPRDRDLPMWEQKMIAFLENTDDPGQRMLLATYLLYYYTWNGQLSTMSRQVRDFDAGNGVQSVSPMTRIMWLAQMAVHAWFRAEHAESLRLVQETLDLAQRFDTHILDTRNMIQGVLAALGAGDAESAGNYLSRIKAILNSRQGLDVGQYHYASAFYFAVVGDLDRAYEHAVQAELIWGQTRIPFCLALGSACLAQMHILRGELRKAADRIDRVRKSGRQMHSLTVEMQACLLQAQIAEADGDEEQLIRTLRRGLIIGREQKMFGIIWWLPSVMESLCTKALQHGLETEYVRELIRKRNCVPESPPFDVDLWPWPVRIYTLGRFAIVKDDRPLEFSRKAQKKPLQLLKVLVAAERKGVQEDRLTYLIWPDAEGDAGHKALGMTVIRLRNLLGKAPAIVVKEGHVSLDPRFCWIDTLAFEHILEQADDAGKRSDAASMVRLLHKSLDLYKGPFLADDPDPWAVSLREKLRSKFFQSIDKLGMCMERSKAYEEALRIYQRGLAVDDLAEPYYQRMMVCYQKLGRLAEALSVYQRCKKTLAAYNLEPSPETQAIRDVLSDKNVGPKA